MTLFNLLPFVAVIGVFWFLIIRPQRSRRDAQLRMIASLEPGSQIMTTSGLFGTVVSVSGDAVRVEVAPGVVVAMVSQAIGQLVEEPEASDARTVADLEADFAADADSDGEADHDADRGATGTGPDRG